MQKISKYFGKQEIANISMVFSLKTNPQHTDLHKNIMYSHNFIKHRFHGKNTNYNFKRFKMNLKGLKWVHGRFTTSKNTVILLS